MKTRHLAPLAATLFLAIAVGLVGQFRSSAPSRARTSPPEPEARTAPEEKAANLEPSAAVDPRLAKIRELEKLPREERDRAEREFYARDAAASLVGPRDWDGKTDGLFPEERPVEKRSRENGGKSLLVTPGAGPTETPKAEPTETIATLPLTKPDPTRTPETNPDAAAKKPAPLAQESTPDGLRRRNPSQVLSK